MRLPAFLTTTLLAASFAVSANAASPPGGVAEINVVIGPKLEKKAKEYGEKEFHFLTGELVESIQRELAKSGGMTETGGKLDLVIEDARPNRPTMQQLSNTPGLSIESRGVGGAEISGTLTTADGRTVPVSYRWYESDFRNTVATSTWTDAENSFDRFASKLAKGEALASR